MKINVLKAPDKYFFAQGPAVFVLENADKDAPDYLLVTLSDGFGNAINTLHLNEIPGDGTKEIYYLDLNEMLAGAVGFEFNGLAELFADAPERLQLIALQFNWIKDGNNTLDPYVYTGAALRGSPDLLTTINRSAADFVFSQDQTDVKKFLSIKPLEYMTTPGASEVLTFINKDVTDLRVRVSWNGGGALALTAAENVVVRPKGFDFIAVENVTSFLSSTTTGATTGHININVSPLYLQALGMIGEDWQNFAVVLVDSKGKVYSETRIYWREDETDCFDDRLYCIFENQIGGAESMDYRRAVFSDSETDAAYMESSAGQIDADGNYTMANAAGVINKTYTKTAGALSSSVLAYTRQLTDDAAKFAGAVVHAPNVWLLIGGYWQSVKPLTTSNTYTPRRLASNDNSKAFQFQLSANYSVNNV